MNLAAKYNDITGKVVSVSLIQVFDNGKAVIVSGGRAYVVLLDDLFDIK